jgi:lipoprotein-releasing system permease protein
MPAADEEVVLASVIADKLGATEGSEIRLIAPFTSGTDAPPRVLKCKVVGIIRMGMHDYDSKFVFMQLAAVQKFLSLPGRVTNFNIKLHTGTSSASSASASGYASRLAVDQLTRSFEYPFRAKDWSQLNRNLFYAIQLEKTVIAIILTVIVVVAAFNVVSTLMMMIHDKSKEIAILKAMGFRKAQSFWLFCLIGVGIGAVGIGLGVCTGLGLGWVLKVTHWIVLPSDIYYIGFLPVLVRWREIGLIAICALAISFGATLYPSWTVSRRSPLEGLRYE